MPVSKPENFKLGHYPKTCQEGQNHNFDASDSKEGENKFENYVRFPRPI